MRSLASASLASLSALLVLACDGRPTSAPTEFVAEFRVAGTPENHATHLKGRNEVPPNGSRAQGQAVFQLSRDGSSLDFRLIVTNIENTNQAHIHMAPAGVNGPIVVWLRPPAPPAVLIPGRSDGVHAVGTITAANLTGPLDGEPFSALIDAIRTGNTYVNVHTSQFPGGEIRGQIRSHGR